MFKIFGDSGFDISFIVILSFFTLLWIISVFIKNVSIVDIAWGLGYAFQIAIFCFTHDYNPYNILLFIIVTFHGLRLSGFIGYRNIGKGEDPRYKKFREKYGGDKHYWWISFFQVFLLQAIISLGICSSFGLFMYKTEKDIVFEENNVKKSVDFYKKPIPALCIVGAVIANFGTWFESIADHQLYVFKSNSNNKGKLMKTGLWSITRHPNYFGETLFWWGTYMFNIAVGQYWAIYSAVVMTLLIIFVSGVANQESNTKEKLAKYGDEYLEYKKNTAKFIPWIW